MACIREIPNARAVFHFLSLCLSLSLSLSLSFLPVVSCTAASSIRLLQGSRKPLAEEIAQATTDLLAVVASGLMNLPAKGNQ